MNLPMTKREFLKAGGALVIGFWVSQYARAQRSSAPDTALGKTLDASEVDGFLAVNADGTVTVFCGKVDLGQGLRIAIPQMAAEELGVDVGRIVLIEGDTALTPDQGATAGSSGVMRGGVQIRQAAATAREALLGLAGERLGRPAAELVAVDGEVRPKSGGAGVRYGELVGGKRLACKIDPKAPLIDPATYRVVGKSLPRPDIPAKVAGRHAYVHDVKVDRMLHGRVIRPSAVGAKLVAVDEASIKAIPDVRVVRIKDFLGVVAADEWDAISAARMLKTTWSDSTQLIGNAAVREWMRAGPFESDETLVHKGDTKAALANARRINSEYYWPPQSHASMGPSCAVADVREGKATIWSASQATHRFRETIAVLLGLPKDAVRVVYVDGSGCYGMNGHDDAAADAALLSRAVGRPVRVQWSRQDEHGWETGKSSPGAPRCGCRRPRRTFPTFRCSDRKPRGWRKSPASPPDSSARTPIRRTPFRIRTFSCTGSRAPRCARPISGRRERSRTVSRSRALPTSSPRCRGPIRSHSDCRALPIRAGSRC